MELVVVAEADPPRPVGRDERVERHAGRLEAAEQADAVNVARVEAAVGVRVQDTGVNEVLDVRRGHTQAPGDLFDGDVIGHGRIVLGGGR
jgi:hypothetical protein